MTTGHNVLVGPSARWVAGLGLAAALVGLGAAANFRPRSYRLSLEAPMQPGCVYFSAWEGGPVYLDHDGRDGRDVTFTRRFAWIDGCTWESTETLTPAGAQRYRYHYDEHPVGCPEGLLPTGLASPRDGFVTVEPAARGAAVTASTGGADGRPANWRRATCWNASADPLAALDDPEIDEVDVDVE